MSNFILKFPLFLVLTLIYTRGSIVHALGKYSSYLSTLCGAGWGETGDGGPRTFLRLGTNYASTHRFNIYLIFSKAYNIPYN